MTCDSQSPEAIIEAGLQPHARTCQGCRLRSNRTQVVLPDGDPRRVIAVGEGPGADEDARGVGFIGKAGQTLDRAMEYAGWMGRADYGRANIVRCRPPENRAPRMDEKRACDSHLTAFIAAVRDEAEAAGRLPPVLLAVGRTASGWLLNRQPPKLPEVDEWITAWEHGATDFPTFLGVPVIPMPHTSGLGWNRRYEVAGEGGVVETRKNADLGHRAIALATRMRPA